MAINSNFYVHDSDRIALDALKAIPGFTPLLKAFMKVWNEKQFYIQNMSTNLRISDKQLSKYYEMLPPICEKLGIEVPELYLELDVNANAYTAGDTKPFIVITSGLLETMPEELIPTVLAHECGHIACHHVLYSTMGRIILSEAINFLGLSELAATPIQMAFYYWMRCSELSADRAAAICDGSPDKVVEMCMRFAGFDKDINAIGNVEEFMNQAHEYVEMMKDSKWNKTLEFLMFNNRTHPLNAVRAYECNEWCKTEKYEKILEYNANSLGESLGVYLGEIPMLNASKYYIGKNYQEVEDAFSEMGFTNIEMVKNTNKGLMTKEGQVISLSMNNRDSFERGDWCSIGSKIKVIYYEPETEEELAAAHPGQLRVTEASKKYLGRIYDDVVEELEQIGFTDITLEKQVKTKKNWMIKEGSIISISINGLTQFNKGEWFDEKAKIHILYNTYDQ